MNKIKRISYVKGTQEWITEDKKYGVSLCSNEICVWEGRGYHGAAISCTLKDWSGKTRQGIRVRELVCHDLGINIPIEIDQFLKNGE